MRGLKGRVAIVTGGGGVIGRAIVRRLAAEGVVVGVFDLDEPAARATANAVAADGERAIAKRVDITDYAAVVRATDELESETGPVSILVNNAGWDRFQNFVETRPEDWEKLISINLRGPLHLHHVVVQRMVARGSGKVVNISSDAARVGSSGEAVYSACKGGMIAFSKTLARELAKQQITVNVVCPGPTDSPILHAFVGEGEAGRKVHAALERAIPFRRLGTGEDVAGLVTFLASDEAGFITGQVISVSGGLTMAG